jgi:hypothetical protein
MYLVTSTVTSIVHLTIEEAKEAALLMRGQGKRSEILSYDEAKRRGLLDPMQDLTKINAWGEVT